MGEWTYLAIDLGALFVPFLFSFHPRLRFYKEWYRLWPALLAMAAVFIAWDAAFTRMGVWSFNPRYTTGVEMFGLPVEELLFFICIPYACLFTYHCFGVCRPDPWWPRAARRAGALLGVGLLIVGLWHADRWYTATTLSAMGMFLLWAAMIAKPRWLGRLLAAYFVLLTPFGVVNGLLTGSWLEQPVVLYNDAENLGIRLGTIPVEDVFYGLLLIALIVALYEMNLRSVDRA